MLGDEKNVITLTVRQIDRSVYLSKCELCDKYKTHSQQLLSLA